ncbi:Uma2 family endonuclease [Nostoc sp. FACHB-152]|uniref:Uma2 family endonuclease n=1 Tax=unclassified Nostoc TaxID=2593658 RepID=UPI00168639B7|nr:MULTISPECIES: Uma2 family endonuclease [unclassified Nostoc]MBD2445760.1 Uma2 family endonuclease [Nostoc sp. FACHB-152]MBD2466874.1 Uma2 family endonuclease [Nostoc sp. FACHB-145]
MSQALTKPITFDEFIEWYPNDNKWYELHRGVFFEMPPPTGEHEKVIAFLSRKLSDTNSNNVCDGYPTRLTAPCP